MFGRILRSARGRGGLIVVIRRALRYLADNGLRKTLRSARRVLSNDSAYRCAIDKAPRLTDEQRDVLIGRLPRHPTVSVIMPVFDPPRAMLVRAIESVLAQSYSEWELCIADDASTLPHVREVLERYRTQEPRIKVVFRSSNGHISAASNSALEIASGDYLALLDHDDELAPDALLRVVEAINDSPEAALIYSDEDKLDSRGNLSEPHFKSDWNYDLFLSYNMICHLGVYATALVRRLGGFRLGYEGAQDYDLALRVIEQIDPAQIVHIPRLLYHWRMHKGSTAGSALEAKPYAMSAGQRALDDHFERKGIRAKASIDADHYRAEYALPEQPPSVTIIIPTRNGLTHLSRCIASLIERTDYADYDILIIDNGSDDPATLTYLQSLQDPRMRVIRDERPFNFSALNNMAVGQARGEIVVLLNDDTEVITPTWLAEMVAITLQPGVGAVGARLWYPDETLQHAGIVVGVGGTAGHAHKRLQKGKPGYIARAVIMQSFSAVTAACLAIRRSVYLEVGGLDEVNLAIAFNDVDFCLRLREAGYRNVWTPYAELYHHESVSRGYETTPEKRARFDQEADYLHKRWSTLIEDDPAYNPNLTLEREDFSYARPSRVKP